MLQHPAQNVPAGQMGAMEGKIGAMAIVTGKTKNARKNQARICTPQPVIDLNLGHDFMS